MLSIIITALNESNIVLNKTINSILETTTNDEIEIIVIDDCSDIPVVIERKERVILERNGFRVGVAQSRHMGATLASKKWLLLTDAHMIFKPDWYRNFIEHQKNATENTIYNGTCLGLWEDSPLNNRPLDELPHYHGANLELYYKEENQILEAKWAKGPKEDNNYEISCLMGAIYFIQKKFFFKIRGLSDLKMWGSDEPCLSLKTLLCGGQIRQLKDVKVAHLFRANAPYVTYNKYLIYNKIRMCRTLLPDSMGDFLIDKMEKNNDFSEAQKLIMQEDRFIQEYKNYYKSIFSYSIEEICEKFSIKI
jgi:glycosyltransferase involved in cell wall biosynthesis